MKEYFTNRFHRILTIIELVIILYFFAGCFGSLSSYVFSGDELETINGIESENGIYTDETVGMEGYFVYGPSFHLDKGIYNITVDYAAEGEDNYILLAALNEGFHDIISDKIMLLPDFNEQQFTARIHRNMKVFSVSVIYCGTGKLEVRNIAIEETRLGRIRSLILAVFWITLLNLVCRFIKAVRKGELNREKLPYIAALSGIVVFASYPLFTTFLTEGHDLLFHLMRIEGIRQGLLAGQFPVRIQPLQYNGYGYACSVFYGELFLYIPAVLRLCGFTIQNAYKIFVILVNVATTLIAYHSFKAMLKDKNIALLCCMVYVLAPYRLANVYVRCAVGEYCAMMFWPMIACGLYLLYTGLGQDEKCSKKDKSGFLNGRTAWIWLVIGYSGLIQTHLLSCEIAAIVSIVACLVMWKHTFTKRIFKELLKFFVSTVLLNAFFLVPLISYMLQGGVYITEYGVSQAGNMQGNGIYPAQLFQLFVNGSGMAYGHRVEAYRKLGMAGEMGMTAGLALIGAGVIFLYLWIFDYNRIKKMKWFPITAWMTLAGFLTLYMATIYFPWDFMVRRLGSLVENLQFPWRMLSVGTLFFTVALGGLLILAGELRGKTFYYMIAGIVSTVTVVTAAFMFYNRLNTSNAVYVYDEAAMTGWGSGSLDEYLLAEAEPKQLNVREALSTQNITIQSYEKNYTNISMTVSENARTEGQVYVPLLGYPGYRAVDKDGHDFTLAKTLNGMLTVLVPAGYEGAIEIYFAGFWYWRAAEIISLAFLVFFVYYVIKSEKKVTDI